MRIIALTLVLCLVAPLAVAQEIGLATPESVANSGLLKHILPRFSLKTGVRVVSDSTGPMRISGTAPGIPVFRNEDTTYFLRIDETDARQTRFRDWLVSDIGRRTVDSFRIGNTQPFSADTDTSVTVAEPAFDGDPELGAIRSREHCGRCHVVSAGNRMSGIGSTPSFAALRSLADWNERFQQFYVLNPHGAFTLIQDVTPGFDPERPPPIAPVRMTLEDVDAILAFVATIEPANLGAPLQLQ